MPGYELRVWCGTGRRTHEPDRTVEFTADTVDQAMQQMEAFAEPLFASTDVFLFEPGAVRSLASTSGGGCG